MFICEISCINICPMLFKQESDRNILVFYIIFQCATHSWSSVHSSPTLPDYTREIKHMNKAMKSDIPGFFLAFNINNPKNTTAHMLLQKTVGHIHTQNIPLVPSSGWIFPLFLYVYQRPFVRGMTIQSYDWAILVYLT